MNAYAALAIAIVAEVIATTALKATNNFSRLYPSLIVIIGYSSAFWFLAISLRTIPVGIAYALWAGLGIVLITIMSLLIYKQVPDVAAILGLALIIAGVMVIQIFSKMDTH